MQEENKIATQLIGTAIDVHRALGPGLLESAYAKCLAVELKDRGLFIAVENFDTLGMNLYTAQRTQVNPALMYYSYVAIGDDLP